MPPYLTLNTITNSAMTEDYCFKLFYYTIIFLFCKYFFKILIK